MPIARGVSRVPMRGLRLWAVSLPLLAGCAAGVPSAIREAPVSNPALSEVQRQPERFIGQPLRWGGTILAVRNHARTTEIELLARPLGQFGEPDADAEGLGRFIAEFAGFKDPTEYPTDRRVTVAGRLARVEPRPIGEFTYVYPVIAVDALHRWADPVQPVLYPAPFMYPYGPWYGRYPGPWYGPW